MTSQAVAPAARHCTAYDASLTVESDPCNLERKPPSLWLVTSVWLGPVTAETRIELVGSPPGDTVTSVGADGRTGSSLPSRRSPVSLTGHRRVRRHEPRKGAAVFELIDIPGTFMTMRAEVEQRARGTASCREEDRENHPGEKRLAEPGGRRGAFGPIHGDRHLVSTCAGTNRSNPLNLWESRQAGLKLSVVPPASSVCQPTVFR